MRMNETKVGQKLRWHRCIDLKRDMYVDLPVVVEKKGMKSVKVSYYDVDLCRVKNTWVRPNNLRRDAASHG